jgi:hypothetical protein
VQRLQHAHHVGVAIHRALRERGVGEHRPLPRRRHQRGVDLLRQQRLARHLAARRCYELWLADESCAPQTGLPGFANLFAFNAANLDRTKDDTGKVDYELPIFNYSTNDDLAAPFLGFADDNYVDGTQSFVFAFIAPAIVELGYGLTTTLIHEVGHHIGLSHPHDGYDYEDDVDYEDLGPFNFASSGDQSNSMMSYIDLNWDFSQFDRDNMNRFLAAAYTSNANRIAAAVLADPDAAKALGRLRAAAARTSAGHLDGSAVDALHPGSRRVRR